MNSGGKKDGPGVDVYRMESIDLHFREMTIYRSNSIAVKGIKTLCQHRQKGDTFYCVIVTTLNDNLQICPYITGDKTNVPTQQWHISLYRDYVVEKKETRTVVLKITPPYSNQFKSFKVFLKAE